jgi:diguanylate cyclase (GGDEF)-like protein/PAS domain S-box-containing protein
MKFNWEDVYKEVIEYLYDGVYITDRNRKIHYWNNGAERISGYLASEVVGFSCKDSILNHVDRQGVSLCDGLCPLAATIADGVARESSVYLHHADGHRIPAWVRTSALKNEKGEIIGAVEIFTELKRSVKYQGEMDELRQSIHHDQLTRLFNYAFMEARLHGVLTEMQHRQGGMGLLFVDIDRFKSVNETFGFEAGDKILRMVASSIRQALRDNDQVARWGGEEFLVLLSDVDTLEKVQHVAEKLRMIIEHSRLDVAGDGSLMISISLGGTLISPEESVKTLVDRAEQLMRRSKKAGRNRSTVG